MVTTATIIRAMAPTPHAHFTFVQRHAASVSLTMAGSDAVAAVPAVHAAPATLFVTPIGAAFAAFAARAEASAVADTTNPRPAKNPRNFSSARFTRFRAASS